MAEELQSLLEKINQDGIMKAQAEKEVIIADARKEAESIIADARKEAENIIAGANKNAQDITHRATGALIQSRRDIILQLREELHDRLHNAVKESTAAALDPQFMAQLVKELAQSFCASPDAAITIRCAVKNTDALDQALSAALADSFAKKPAVFPGNEIVSGMEVSFDGGKCFYDFTLDAVSDLMDSYIGEQLKEIFQAAK